MDKVPVIMSCHRCTEELRFPYYHATNTGARYHPMCMAALLHDAAAKVGTAHYTLITWDIVRIDG